MTGLEPHPIFTLPTVELIATAGAGIADPVKREAAEKAYFQACIAERKRRMEMEAAYPYENGYRPPIWHVADELLIEGKEVVLADPDWDIEDPELRKIRPPDFLEAAMERRRLGLGPLVILGRRELWIAGSNRSSKTEYAAYKINKIGASIPHARTWSWSDSEEKSRAKQHPIIFKYLPREWKNMLNHKGKASTREMKMGYANDEFIGNKFSTANGWKHWFNNYKQSLQDVEGDQLDASWHDEERDPERVKTVRVRLGDRRGIMLVTFTSIDDSFTAIVSEYETGMQVLLEVEAEWLPKDKGSAATPFEKVPGMTYEKVRRVAIAGPGSDGDQNANILWFHISDNPYYGYNPHAVYKPGDPWPIYGKKAFYINQNIANATRTKILSRGYGILTRGAMQQFRFNTAIHLIDPRRIPTVGSRYHILDPCPGRNWFMIWLLIDPQGRWFIYREWPSHSGNWPSAYIPGIGDPGPWALPGTRGKNSNKVVYDGIQGPAQQPFRFGLTRYKQEIDRLEGRVKKAVSNSSRLGPQDKAAWKEGVRKGEVWLTGVRRHGQVTQLTEAELDQAWEEARNRKLPPSALGLPGDIIKPPPDPFGRQRPATIVGDPLHDDFGGEDITERWMDSRYAGSPTVGKEAPTTNIEQMGEIGLYFRAAPSEQNMLTRDDGSVAMINELLDYDDEVKIGEFSPRLARANEPRLFVSTECPNVAFALKEWTGKDGGHGACKDPADCVRYAALCDLDYIGADAFRWVGGGMR